MFTTSELFKKFHHQVSLQSADKEILSSPKPLNCSYDATDATITNQKPIHFKNYFNANDFSDTMVEVLNESGQVLGTLKAHKIVLCRNNILKERLQKNRTVSIVGNFDVVKTFIEYLYTNQADETKLVLELHNISCQFGDSFLGKACENQILKRIEDLPSVQVIDEFLLAVKNKSFLISSLIAKHIATNYSEFSYRNEFSNIRKDQQALKLIFDALESINKQLKRRLAGKKLRFDLKLSWTKKAVYVLEESSAKWQFEVYREIDDNEDWMYFNYNVLCVGDLMIKDFIVKLLPNPQPGHYYRGYEKTCEGNSYSATRFLRWSYIMDPENGYINKGTIKVELQLSFVQRKRARKSALGPSC